jgi:hypothetical protein
MDRQVDGRTWWNQYTPLQLCCGGYNGCRMITWVVFLRMFWNFISSLPVKRGGSLSFLTIFTFAVPELLDLIWRKIGFLQRDPPLFTGKLLIKFQNILRNTTQVIIRHRVKILFSVISSPITLERQKWKSSKKKGILVSSHVRPSVRPSVDKSYVVR